MRLLSLLSLTALLALPQLVDAAPKAATGRTELRLRLSAKGQRAMTLRRLLPAPAVKLLLPAPVKATTQTAKTTKTTKTATTAKTTTKTARTKRGSEGIWFKNDKGKLSQLDRAAAEKLFGIKWTRKQTLGIKAKDLPGYTDGVGFNFDADGEIVDPPVHKQYKPNFSELKAIAGKTAPIYVQKVSQKVGYGLFARGTIKKGSPVGQYAGVVRRGDDKADRLNAYTFVYDPWNHFKMVVDAEKSGNYMRFANHSAKSPNMEAKLVYREKSRRWHVLLIAKKEIKKGDQLLFNYSSSYDWSRFGINEPKDLSPR
jgi:hypothetical protein